MSSPEFFVGLFTKNKIKWYNKSRLVNKKGEIMERNTILEFLKKNTQEFNKFGVKKIGLFGSFASRRNTNNSDIDILVEFKTGEKTFDNYMDLKFFLEDRLKRKVDLVIEKNIKTELKEEILSTAKYA